MTSPGSATSMGPVNVPVAASRAIAGSVPGHRWVSTSRPAPAAGRVLAGRTALLR